MKFNMEVQKVHSNRVSSTCLFFCVEVYLILLVGNYTNISFIKILGIVVFFIGAVVVPAKEFLIYFLFFLPFISIIKIPGITFSLFIGIPLIFIIRMGLNGELRIKINRLFLISFLFVFTIGVKILRGLSISGDYITSFTLILFVSLFVEKFSLNDNYEDCILAYAYGFFMSFATSRLLNVGSAEAIIRLNTISIFRASGLAEDPNYFGYSAIMLIGLLLGLSISKKVTKRKKTYYLIWAAVELILALLTVSKMVMFVSVGIFACYIMFILFSKGNRTLKVIIPFGILILVIISKTTGVFDGIISSYVTRMEYTDIKNMSSLTSSRWDIWLIYIDGLLNDVTYLLFGQGYSAIVPWGNMYAHNTFIQLFYQLGIIGTSAFAIWFFSVVKGSGKIILCKSMFIIVLSFLLPISTLDVLLFDNFFAMILIIGISNYYYTNEQ